MPKILESDLEGENVIENPHFEKAIRILNQKKWQGVEFLKRSGEKIVFAPEIESDPKNPKDWILHLLYIPAVKKPDHSHIFFGLQDIKKIQKFLNQLVTHIEKLEGKRSKRSKPKGAK